MKKNQASEAKNQKVREADEIISSDDYVSEEYTTDISVDDVPVEDTSVVSVLDADSLESWSDDSSWEDSEEADYFPVSVSSSTSRDSVSRDIVKYDPLQSYLQEIKHIPSLTKDEEQALAIKYKQEGDKSAGLKLVVSNLRLVVMIAREHQRNVQNILDLVQEGNIGLLEAVEKYDPYRGVRFPSYAVYWIRAYILRYLINNIRLVKIGTTQAQRKLFFNLVKEKEKLEQEGFIPEARLLADRLGVKESEVIEMQQRLHLPDVSVDAPVNRADGDSIDMHSVLPAQQEDQEELLIDADFNAAVRDGLEEFKKNADPKEVAIIEERLFSEEPKTLQEIADSFSISRERIRQIETRLKERLKKFFTTKLDLDEERENNDF